MPFTTYGSTTTPTAGSGFAGSGLTRYSELGITSVEAGQKVTVSGQQSVPTATNATNADQAIINAAPQVMTIADALAQFKAAYVGDPSYAASIQQDLYNAGLLSSSSYNSGQISDADTYNAYKQAVLNAAASGVPVDQYIQKAAVTFAAQGGPKVKLPAYKVTIPLTSYDDMSQAADAAFEKVLGHMAPVALKQALTGELNNLEQQAGAQKAQGDYQYMLAWRGLNPDGTPTDSPFGPANTSAAPPGTPGVPAGAPLPAPTGDAVNPQALTPSGGTTVAGLPTQVTNAQGDTSTVTQGPIPITYNAPPSPDALAYQTALQNNPDEVKGRIMAQAAQAIAAMFSKGA